MPEAVPPSAKADQPQPTQPEQQLEAEMERLENEMGDPDGP